MSKSCNIIPQVTGKDGKKHDSRLFLDLLSFTKAPRDVVSDYIYKKIYSEEFKKAYFDKLDFDEYNEPTIVSIMEHTNLASKYHITDERMLEIHNRNIGYYSKKRGEPALWSKEGPKGDERYMYLKRKIVEFNRSQWGKYFFADIVSIYDKENHKNFWRPVVIKKDPSKEYYSQGLINESTNRSLNAKLKDILARHGVSIGTLTDIEERMKLNGVTEFNTARKTAEGLIEFIRLAKGERGEKALPEEFAHWAIAALGDNPLVGRIISLIKDKGLAKQIIGETYDSYVESYKGNEDLLAKEAAGKLVAKHLLKNEEIKDSPYKSLLQRLIDAIKNFFGKFNPGDIRDAITSVDREAKVLASELLNNSLDNDLRNENIKDLETLYSKALSEEEKLKRDRELVSRIIKNETKRLNIYRNNNPNSNWDNKQKALIDELQYSLLEHTEIAGIQNFLDTAYSSMNQLISRMKQIEEDTSMTVKDRASVLRDVKNYINSYSRMIEDISDTLQEDDDFSEDRFGAKTKARLDECYSLVGMLNSKFKSLAMPMFVNFLKEYLGDGLVVKFGKYKGEKITAENIARKSLHGKDITAIDRWLKSMADSTDYVIKIMDQAIKKSKGYARQRTIETRTQLLAALKKLEDAGVSNTDWMFERNANGNPTGYYISEVDLGKYTKAKNDFLESLHKKYGDRPVGRDMVSFNREERAWIRDNTELKDGHRVPLASKYKNDEWEKIHSGTDTQSKAKLEFYNTIMEIKSELDGLLPEGVTHLHNAVKIRKDWLERIKSSGGVGEGAKSLVESLKDTVIQRSDDTDMEDKTLRDFEGREVEQLPIYYIKFKDNEQLKDLSTDIASTLTAYASMAYDYDEMNSVIDQMELSRTMAREREIVPGKTSSKAEARLDDGFSMQVYNRYIKDEGSIGGVSIAKLADMLNAITAVNTLGVNAIAAATNVGTGTAMMRIEAAGREFYRERDVHWGDKTYLAAIPQYLAEIGNRIKTSKMALWIEKFDVLQDYSKTIRNQNYDRKTWFSRMFGINSIFFLNNAGDHWMQIRTSLALAHTYKMKDPKGNEVNLWDAMEVEYLDPNNKSLGARLVVKEGYTKTDGTEFSRDDVNKFTRKVASINQKMHGIYNKEDRDAFQRLAIGRITEMYRKWIVPNYVKRFSSVTYNFDTESWSEGYYKTLGRFIWQLKKDLLQGEIDIVSEFRQLDDVEKANIRRGLTEVAIFVIIWALREMFNRTGDDDKKKSWLRNMGELYVRRLYTEIAVLTPVGGTSIPREALRIVKSPAAAVNTTENILNLIDLLNPFMYFDDDTVIQQGRYKGHRRWYKTVNDAIPMNKTIYRIEHPEELLPFYKQ